MISSLNDLCISPTVDGAIHQAANFDLLQAECSTFGGCETGNAVITGGYKLPAKCNILIRYKL